jgi:hypothetical protein
LLPRDASVGMPMRASLRIAIGSSDEEAAALNTRPAKLFVSICIPVAAAAARVYRDATRLRRIANPRHGSPVTRIARVAVPGSAKSCN